MHSEHTFTLVNRLQQNRSLLSMPDSLGFLRHQFLIHDPLEHRIAALGGTALKGQDRVSDFATILRPGNPIQDELLRKCFGG